MEPTAIDQLRTELHQMFHSFQEQVNAQLQQNVVPPGDASPARSSSSSDEPVEDPMDWPDLVNDLPSPPIGTPAPALRIYRLAKELKRRAAKMTEGRDLHDIHTVLHLAAHWEVLQSVTRAFLAHRIRLLYIAVTKGWPAALYFDQQGTDEFLDLPAEFWAGFRPPARPKVAQPRTTVTRGRSSRRRGRRK
jgi:hypothetical protein